VCGDKSYSGHSDLPRDCGGELHAVYNLKSPGISERGFKKKKTTTAATAFLAQKERKNTESSRRSGKSNSKVSFQEEKADQKKVKFHHKETATAGRPAGQGSLLLEGKGSLPFYILDAANAATTQGENWGTLVPRKKPDSPSTGIETGNLQTP